MARIYMPQKKHVHNHGFDKSIGKFWVVDFETEATYKSPLMQWTSATTDCFNSKGDMLAQRFPTADDAVAYVTMMGWGYSVTYPKFKYHSVKNYANNFKYKGPAPAEKDYDLI